MSALALAAALVPTQVGGADAAVPTVTSMAPAAGSDAGGTEVVIGGEGLEAAASVSFGDRPAAFWRIDTAAGAATITAVSPPHTPGAVEVGVGFGPGVPAPARRPFLYFGGAGWRPDAPMATGRAYHSATLLAGGKVLVAGGNSPAGVTASAEVHDPGGPAQPGTWNRTGSLHGPRAQHTATLLDPPGCRPGGAYPCGTVLVAGGTTAPADQILAKPPLGTAETYDAATGSWSPTSPLMAARVQHTATLLGDGRVLLAGGIGPSGVLAGVELYDPPTRSFSASAPLSAPRTAHSATLLDPPFCHDPTLQPPAGYPCGAVLVAGGRPTPYGEPVASAEVLAPAAAADGPPAWAARPTGSMLAARAGHTATLLGDGRVLVAAGSAGTAAELYDPAAGTWRATAPTLDVHTGAVATALADGTVLVTGGGSGPSSEVFDPSGSAGSGTWRPGPRMSRLRSGHSATPVGGDRVLLAGGGSSIPADFAPENLLTGVDVIHLGQASTETLGGPPPGPAVNAVDPVAAGGGTAVTIRGAFLFPPTVRFGDAAATVTFATDAEVSVLAPPRPPGTTVIVTVSTPRGASSPTDGAAQFTYAAGAWSPTGRLDGCTPWAACTPRSAQTAVRLDPASCQPGGTPPPGYPCGSVLVAGDSSRLVTFSTTYGSNVVTSDTAEFGPGDLGKVFEDVPDFTPYVEATARITKVLDERRVEVAGTALTTSQFRASPLTGSSAEIYRPATRSWAPAAPMAVQRTDTQSSVGRGVKVPGFTATLLSGGDVLVTGGNRAEDPLTALASAEVYHPASNTWESVPAMPAGRVGHTATLLDPPFCRAPADPRKAGYPCGRVLVAGGQTGTSTRVGDYETHPQVLDTALVYDPDGRAWQPTTDTTSHAATGSGTARAGHTATLLSDGEVLLAGGVGGDGATLRSSDLFDPATGRWRPAGALQSPGGRLFHSATLLMPASCPDPAGPPGAYPCGAVLAVGGFGGRASAELFDPATRTWAMVADGLRHNRALHSATLLPDGRVLLAGDGSGPDSSAAAELFDPVRRRFSLTAGMATSRSGHTATLLDGPGCAPDCGTVLVAGGTGADQSRDFLSVDQIGAELYLPPPVVTGVSPGAGPSAGGTAVRVRGAGFGLLGPDPAVRFGEDAAGGVDVVSDTELVAVTPPHGSGDVDVVVSGRAGPSTADPSARFRYTVSRLPGRVGDLRASAPSSTTVELRFSAVASDGTLPPPAGRYVVKQSETPILDDAGFAAAESVCRGACSFTPGAMGGPLVLTVHDLDPATTYHYAVKAVNDLGTGPLSNPAEATTPGGGPAQAGRGRGPDCGDARPGAAGASYPAGWSLVGLPTGTALPVSSPLYGWYDQGAGGRYAIFAAGRPLEGGRGYWAWFGCPTAVAAAGPGRDSVSVPLRAMHASMVANPSAAGPARASGFDYAARWDPSLANGSGGYRISGYREAQTLAVGEGIWVFSFSDTTVTVSR